MAKTIKFNLDCDDHSIRTIEDLREHFSVEDILNYYWGFFCAAFCCIAKFCIR